MNKRTDEQRDAEWERAFGGEERVEWMHWQRSIFSGQVPCVSAHIHGGGVARRADSCWTVPTTWAEHQDMHDEGQESYAARHGLTLDDLDVLAARTETRWQHHLRSTARPAW